MLGFGWGVWGSIWGEGVFGERGCLGRGEYLGRGGFWGGGCLERGCLGRGGVWERAQHNQLPVHVDSIFVLQNRNTKK